MNTSWASPLIWLFFSLKGRIARQSFILAIVFLQIILGLIIYKIVQAGEDQSLLTLWGIVLIFTGAYMMWCAIALAVKRLHDLGMSGFTALVLFIPPASWFFILFLMIKAGEPHANQYGKPPFGPTGLNNA